MVTFPRPRGLYSLTQPRSLAVALERERRNGDQRSDALKAQVYYKRPSNCSTRIPGDSLGGREQGPCERAREGSGRDVASY